MFEHLDSVAMLPPQSELPPLNRNKRNKYQPFLCGDKEKAAAKAAITFCLVRSLTLALHLSVTSCWTVELSNMF